MVGYFLKKKFCINIAEIFFEGFNFMWRQTRLATYYMPEIFNGINF